MQFLRLKQLAVFACGLGLAAVGFSSPAYAQQNFPTRPIRIISPYPAGLGPDVLARIVADKMGTALGQAVIVDNRPGASGFVAFEAAKHAAPDGYTLVQMDNFHIGTQPHLYKKLPYDAFKDFEPITPLVKNYFFIVVPASSKWQTVGDLVAAAKARPGQVTYGSWAVASPAHLGGVMLERAAQVKMLHVPYKESSQLYQAVGNNEVDWAFGSAISAGPMQQAGKVRFLATASPERIAAYPDVPTASQAAGPKDFQVGGWTGILAPRGLPKEVAARLHGAIVKAMASPEVGSRLATFSYERYTMSPGEMGKLMQAEVDSFGRVIKDANISLD